MKSPWFREIHHEVTILPGPQVMENSENPTDLHSMCPIPQDPDSLTAAIWSKAKGAKDDPTRQSTDHVGCRRENASQGRQSVGGIPPATDGHLLFGLERWKITEDPWNMTENSENLWKMIETKWK